MVTICKNCKFHWVPKFPLPPADFCKSEDAFVTDYVSGRKECYKINETGACPFYQPKEEILI